jgi:hypothetical protein
MALTSPGVEVTVIDESFYTSAEPGSVPLIVVATAENKLNGGGTAVAAGTLASNATNVYRISSQRELTETFGVPFFEKTATNNPVHGGERNEYGLLAAYSLLGATNSAFIMRANVDLNELAPTTVEPGAERRDGTWWINTSSSAWGIQEWNNATANVDGGQKFAAKTPVVLTDDDTTRIDAVTGLPKESFGSIGDYAIVYKTIESVSGYDKDEELARLYFKSAGNGDSVAGIVEAGEWVLVGSPEWTASWPVIISTGTVLVPAGNAGDTFTINGTMITLSSGDTAQTLAGKITGVVPGVIASAIRNRLYIFSDGETDPTDPEDSTRSNAIVIANGSELGLFNEVVDGELEEGVLKISAGTFFTPRIVHAPHTRRPQFKRTETTGSVGYPTGSLWIKTTEPNGGARLRVTRWSTGAKAWVPQEALLFANATEALFNLDRSGGGRNILVDTLFTQYNAREHIADELPSYETAEFRIWRRKNTGATTITSAVTTDGALAGDSVIHIRQTVPGSAALTEESPIVFRGVSGAGIALDNANSLAALINAASFVDSDDEAVANNIVASVTDDGRLVITHTAGGEIRFRVIEGSALNIFTPFNLGSGTGTQNFYEVSGGIVTGSSDTFVASNWIPLAASQNPSYYPSPTAPLEEPEDGQLWFNPTYDQVDIMVHDGETWVGYKNYSEISGTNPTGPIVSASRPEFQSDGFTTLKEGDLWISTADLENYPTIYKFNSFTNQWVLVDKSDQTTEDGILFADARTNADGETNTPASIVDLLTSDFLDFDAPDPALYPRGMLLWNTRRSYGNVKRYVRDYVDLTQDNPRYTSDNRGVAEAGGESMSDYYADRWITASPNNEDGSGSFGRKAQRAVVVAAMKSAIDTSEEARDEERRNFNLIACPGYPETLSNLVNLNIDRKLTAFVIGDTPLRLRADTTSLLSYATNARLVTDNGDAGIVTFDEYAAVYYPNGFTTDLSGSNAVVPASHMMLRTMILSDKASYPWFAPAGTRRGGITNATSVGYIDASTGEFKTVALNNGQRDTLYEQKINPIPFFVGVGHVAYGQKTRSRNASATDRINVARLVVYLRSQLNKLARPYLFEPNDKKTRDEVKGAVESLLIELVGLRGIYDFGVVCDESNNTPDRVDRNELWVDVAIEPTKAVEFIYIPLRLKNTGEI